MKNVMILEKKNIYIKNAGCEIVTSFKSCLLLQESCLIFLYKYG